MASSSKFDLSSGSPDRPLYSAGQRGSHAASSMDRSASFRESMDNSVSSSLPSLSRNSSSVGQAEVLNFFQCLPSGTKLTLDHKSNRQGDLKRNIAGALGISPENSPSNISKGKPLAHLSQEELKRVKIGLRDCSAKASERVRYFDEALSLINKFFPSLSTKKRSRSEVFSNERAGSMVSSDRSMLGQGLGKVGSQNNIIGGSFEHELQKSDERTKNSVPSKRRTSLAEVKPDVRGHGPMRPSGPVDRDRELPKLANSGSVQCDDRTLPIGVDGWEKSKMKKKRSVIKPDATSGAIAGKPVDGYREPKQGLQQRSINNSRPRLNNDSHGFRPGFGNGSLGVGKGEPSSQQTGLSSRASNPKVDNDGNPLLGDKRDRPMSSDKERMNLKAVNKASCRDDFNSSSPTSNSRMNSSIRAPRSSSGAAPKVAPLAARATLSNDWEAPHCTNRPPAVVGANNRKRTASARSASPPSAHWPNGQKPNRSARRTNLGPVVSSNDEASPMDTMTDAVGNEAGLGFPRRLPTQLVKLKGDLLSSSPISEGEDSGATETKPRDRVKKSDEVEEKSGHHIQKLSALAVPSRKNKSVSAEDHVDGNRKQGRTGRGFTSSRSLLPMSVEKLGHEETAKQLRSARISFDKNESKAGRPPTRKLSERKSYTRQRHASINASADFFASCNDGHEELVAAANAVIDQTHLLPKSIWREKEPLFGFISDVDIDYLKQQENLASAIGAQNLVHDDADDHVMVPGVFGTMSQRETRLHNAGQTEVLAKDKNKISLCERLLAALIPEAEADYCINGNDDTKFDAYGTRHELDGNFESNGFGYEPIQNVSALNGYMVTGMSESQEHRNDVVSILRTRSSSGFDRPINGLIAEQELTSGIECSESPYDSMDINEKLLLEMQSIGIFPEALPSKEIVESGGISDEISTLVEKYHVQASKKKGVLDRLLKSALETKQSQEKEFEQLALDQLVGMAFEKYMMCWGHGGPGGKSSSNKMAKQAALAFVKRTLERCKQFEDTGKSCFSEPLFKEVFLSGSSPINLVRLTDSTVEASKSSQQSPSVPRLGQTTDQYDVTSDTLLPTNHLSERAIGKEETWLNRVKKRELMLDEVVGSAIGNSFTAPGIGTSLVSSTKGKRSERDREGKGHNREVLSRTGNAKSGRSSVSTAKGERKSKAKPKQKTTQLSVSINGLLGNTSDQSKPVLASGSKQNEVTTARNSKEKVEFGLDHLDDTEALDFSNLQLPGMDVLGVSDDLGGQGQDLASWLNIDDDNLQDHDFLGLEGLEIPMDDLSDLNMMV